MPRLRDKRRDRLAVRRERMKASYKGNTPVTPIEASKELGECVYFVRTHDDLIKIGYTSQLHRRRHGLGIEWDAVLAVMAGTKAHESACHALYAQYLARGREYFHPAPELIDHINAIRVMHNVPPIEHEAP